MPNRVDVRLEVDIPCTLPRCLASHLGKAVVDGERDKALFCSSTFSVRSWQRFVRPGRTCSCRPWSSDAFRAAPHMQWNVAMGADRPTRGRLRVCPVTVWVSMPPDYQLSCVDIHLGSSIMTPHILASRPRLPQDSFGWRARLRAIVLPSPSFVA